MKSQNIEITARDRVTRFMQGNEALEP